MSDAPSWGRHRPQRWILDQRLSEINSRVMLARGRDHVGVLSAATGGIWLAVAAGEELGAPIGTGDELRAGIVDEHGCWGSFELFRSSNDSPFDAADAQLMRDAGRILAPALREGHVAPTDERAAIPGQPGVLLIDDQLRWPLAQEEKPEKAPG